MDQVTLGLNLTMASGSISDTHPSLAADWDYERNALEVPTLSPQTVSAGSNHRVWWGHQRATSNTGIILMGAPLQPGHGPLLVDRLSAWWESQLLHLPARPDQRLRH